MTGHGSNSGFGTCRSDRKQATAQGNTFDTTVCKSHLARPPKGLTSQAAGTARTNEDYNGEFAQTSTQCTKHAWSERHPFFAEYRSPIMPELLFPHHWTQHMRSTTTKSSLRSPPMSLVHWMSKLWH